MLEVLGNAGDQTDRVHSAGFLDQLTDQSHSKVKNKAKYKHLVDYFYLKTILAELSVIIVYEFSR